MLSLFALVALCSSILLGSMLFLTGIVTPAVHRFLDEEVSGQFIRQLFPRFYLWGIAMTTLAILFALGARSATTIMLLIVLLGFVYSRQVLMAKLNKAKDEWLASDSVQHKTRFQKLHKRSIIINITQMILLLITGAASTWTLLIR